MTRSGWLFLLSMSLPLVACVQAGAYTLKDSGVSATRDGEVAWFDNQQVLFYQMKVGKNNERLALEPFIWDTVSKSVSPYPVLQGSRKLNVCGEFVPYIRRKVDVGFVNEWLLVYGTIRDGQIVEGQVTDFPNPSAINAFSCRYYRHPYPWTVKGRRTTPLLEEHGYLDSGSGDQFSKVERSLTLYRPGISEGVPVSLPRGVGGPMGFAPFRNAYLFVSLSYRDPVTGKLQDSMEWPKGKPMSAWWLTPDGQVTEESMPYHPFMSQAAGGDFLPVKGGVFAWSHAVGLGTSLGEAGGYLARGGTTRKVITGLLHHPVVSPDGCRVAFVHDPYDTMFAKDRRNRITVKILDLCDGGTHE